MKNYRVYKKPEEVYFSGEIAFPITLTIIAALITYGLLYFFGLTIAILFNVLISWCAYYYLYYYGKSNTRITLAFLTGVAFLFAFLLYVDYGVYLLVDYQKKGVFQEFYFWLWLSLLLGIPFSYYIYQYSRYYFKELSMATEFLKIPFKIIHDRELLLCIDNVRFINSSKHTMFDTETIKPLCFYSATELHKMDKNFRNYHLEQNPFSNTIHIPFDTDSLLISWYSIIEDKYYDIQLPFPFKELPIEQEKYPTNVLAILRGKKSPPLTLSIYPNGGIQLFNSDKVLINIPESISKCVSLEERNKKIEFHRNSHDYYFNPQAFSGLIERIKNSGGIEERQLIQNKKICWGMIILGIKGNNYLETTDASLSKDKSEITEMETAYLRLLPKKLVLVYKGYHLYPWLTLRIDTQKLFQNIQTLTDGDDQATVFFELTFENISETDLEFKISVNQKSILFQDWEIEINTNNKESMENHILDIDLNKQKLSLYNEAWDLIFNKQYNLALEKCKKLKALDPKYGFAYFLEVRILWHTEGIEACFSKKDYFITKTQHDPAALAHIYNNYGCLYDQQSRYEESLSCFEKAIQNNPNEGMYVCNLAEIYCKLNNPKKALEEAKKAKKLMHQSPTLSAILESNGLQYL